MKYTYLNFKRDASSISGILVLLVNILSQNGVVTAQTARNTNILAIAFVSVLTGTGSKNLTESK